MNPILLKPTTDVGSQVIVNGKVRGNMKAADYFRHKKELIPDIVSAYNALASQHDIIVIEGAGSPVELNLKADDIVNMGLAELVKSPVLLVGDIDRGGVFAQLIGTLELLENNEREKVKGLVVNKFRGDISLFKDGIDILESRSHKKVAGVIPYISCDVEDEDSLSEKLNARSADGVIDIAVIHLPKISNFTDMDFFGQYDGVSVRYVSKASKLGKPDMIIIPGTKSTIADMKWLDESGLANEIRSCCRADIPVFGICGGYQIMGRSISDPSGSECGGSISGLGLLSCDTLFSTEKTQSQTTGKFGDVSGFFSCLSGAEFYGYEVHMGVTESHTGSLTSCGGSFDGNAAGCYVHGVFDSAEVSGRLIKALYQRKGMEYRGSITDRSEYRNSQLDLLADNVRKNIDMELVYRIIEEGV